MIYYVLTLVGALALSALCVALMPRFRHVRVANLCFFLAVFVPYLFFVQIIYNSVGSQDWNFRNALPVANVSPFMFTISPICFLLPRKFGGGYFRLLVALLTVGMFLSPILNCVYYISINYAFHGHFLLDFLSHFALGLWGIYLVRSEQVSLRKKDALIAGSIIVGAALVMLLLNAILDTGFFGLNLRGRHNIYNRVLVKNSYLSALLYFTGLIGVEVLGFFFQKGMRRLGKVPA